MFTWPTLCATIDLVAPRFDALLIAPWRPRASREPFGECSAADSAAQAWSIGLSERYSLQQPIRHSRLLGMGRFRANAFDEIESERGGAETSRWWARRGTAAAAFHAGGALAALAGRFSIHDNYMQETSAESDWPLQRGNCQASASVSTVQSVK